MELRVLGPLELARDGVPIRVGGPKERALLAVLALEAGRAVPEDRLIEVLWGDDPPRTATRTLQAYLSRLRRALGEAVSDGIALESTPGGCRLRLPDGASDLQRVQARAERARTAASAGRHVQAILELSEALGEWRGRALGEFADEAWALPEAARLEELRARILEERLESQLACGRHHEVIGELEALCGLYPFRERLWGLRMTALYRAGRQAEALRVYQQLRHYLGEELGIEPSPELARLESAILRQDPALELATPVPRGFPAGTTPAPTTLGPERIPTPTPGPDPLPGPAAEPSAGGRPAGVTRLVTLLFTDLVSSTELLDTLGDDSFESLRRAHFRLLRKTVEAGGGDAVKNLGDGLMAVFPSAVDAVACAVEVQRAVARLNRRSSSPLGLRVGLHVGEPVRDESDYFGNAVVVAKRLCDLAAGGQVVASRLVADLVAPRGQFRFSDLGPLVLKGITEPVLACEVTWQGSVVSELPSALQSIRATTFVGRDAQLAQLSAAWERAESGHLQVVLLAGEPGIGKTALAIETAATAASGGAVVLFGRCDEEALVPFQPFVEALAHYISITDAAQLRTTLGAEAADIALLVPSLGRKLPEHSEVVGTGAETERYRIFEAVPSVLAAIGADVPVLLVLDDLHWADRPTLQLMHHLIRRGGDLPLLIVGTYRDTDLVRTHPMAEVLADLRRAQLVDRLPIRGLSRDDVVALIRGGADPSSEDLQLAEAVWAETDGSPLFLREVMRHLAETDAISREEDGRWRARRRIDQLGIPEGVREVIGRRLTRLSDAANEALRIGSLMGREMRLEVLERVSDLGADALLDALDEAAAAGIIQEDFNSVGRYQFTHALVRQALYDELSLTRRVRLHQRVGEAIESIAGDNQTLHLSELAYHFSQAAVTTGPEKAVDYARRAAEDSIARVAYEDAVRYYAMALEVAEDGEVDLATRADLRLDMGRAQWRAGDGRAARATHERVADLVGDTDPERLGLAALGYAGAEGRSFWVDMGLVNHRTIDLLERALAATGAADGEIRARLMVSLAQELFMVPGTRQRREQLSSDALAIARRLGDPATLASVLCSRTLATWTPDNVDERLAQSAEVLKLAAELGDPLWAVSGHAHRMATLFERGDIPGSNDHLAAFARVSADSKDAVALSLSACCQGLVLAREGRFIEAEALAAESFRLGQEARDPNAFPLWGITLGLCRVWQGRIAELVGAVAEGAGLFGNFGVVQALDAVARAEAGMFDEARDIVARIRSDPSWTEANFDLVLRLAALARVAYRLADADLAAVLHGQLERYADRPASVGMVCIGSNHQALGLTATVMGRYDEAEDHFQNAIAAHREAGWLAVLVETQVFYAAMLAARSAPGDAAKALELLADALSTAQELGMAGMLREGEAVRAALDPTAATVSAAKSIRTIRRRDRVRAKVTVKGRALAARWAQGRTDAELANRVSAVTTQRALFGAMARAFQPAMAFGFEGDIGFELRPSVEDADQAVSDWWTIEVRGDKATARRGLSAKPVTVFHVDLVPFVRLAAGELHPVRALMEGIIEIEGDVYVAARLGDMFGAAELVDWTEQSGQL
jgi:DNA-binding SARP family transcriptional activator/class 3 adenylate cyclase